MSFIKRWDTGDIKYQLGRCGLEMNSTYNDGFVRWDCKKDLLELKYYLEELLYNAPGFGEVEQGFIEDKEKQKIWKILNNKV